MKTKNLKIHPEIYFKNRLDLYFPCSYWFHFNKWCNHGFNLCILKLSIDFMPPDFYFKVDGDSED